MKLLYIHQHFATEESAGGVRSYLFSRQLVNSGHSVTVITSNHYLPEHLKHKHRFFIDGIQVVNIQTGYSKNVNFIKRVMSFVKFMIGACWIALMRTDCDIVFSTSTPLTVGIPGYLVKMLKGVPFVFEVRDLWPDVPYEMGVIKSKVLFRILKCLEKNLYRYADLVICTSLGIEKCIDPSAKNTITLPIGSDLSLFRPGIISTWKQDHGLQGKTVIVYTGAVGMANEPEYMISACRLLQKEENDSIVLVIVGDGSAKQNTIDLANKYQLENVKFFDPVAKSKLPEILAVADAGIILHGTSKTYLQTAGPNKFYDYIAAGVPVIFNFESPLKDVIIKHKLGYYVRSKKPEELKKAMVHLHQNLEEARSYGKNARRYAEKHFDNKKIARLFEEIMEKMLKCSLTS